MNVRELFREPTTRLGYTIAWAMRSVVPVPRVRYCDHFTLWSALPPRVRVEALGLPTEPPAPQRA